MQQLHSQDFTNQEPHTYQPCLSPPTKIIQEEFHFNDNNKSNSHEKQFEVSEEFMDFAYLDSIFEEVQMISYEPTNPFLNQMTFKIPPASLFVQNFEKKKSLELESEKFHSITKKRKSDEGLSLMKRRKSLDGLSINIEVLDDQIKKSSCGNFESVDHFFEEIEKQTNFTLSFI
eukprot:gene9849-2172_t